MLREDNEHKGHKYLCSNPNCRKVFSRPKIIKYQVCPACQTLVNIAEAENQDEIPISFAFKKSVKQKKLKIVEADNSERLTRQVQPASVEPPLEEQSVPQEPEGSEEAIVPEQVQMPPVQQMKALEAETVSQSSSNCQYGFGYLGRREKGEEIPDTCVECPKSLNCMLSDYYKKEESVAEIKKWYAT